MKLQTGNGATLSRNLPVDIMAEELLSKIAHLLMAKAQVASDPTIPMGKAGISLFLFHYYQYCKKEEYYNKAYALLDQVYECLSDPATPVHKTLQPQLGWLFMHLQKHDLIDLNIDEVLDSTDAALCNICVHEEFKQLSDNYIVNIGLYLLERYQHTENRLKKMRIEEALISLADEINALYTCEIKKKIIDIYQHEQTSAELVLNKLIRTTCNTSLLLAKIAATGIYKQVISDRLYEINETVIAPFLSHQQICKSLSPCYPDYSTLIYTLFTQTYIRPFVMNGTVYNYRELTKSGISGTVYSAEPTPYTGDLLLIFSGLRLLNSTAGHPLFTEHFQELSRKIHASFHKNACGYLDGPVGIPDLGLKDGMAGAGIAMLASLKNELLITADLILIITD